MDLLLKKSFINWREDNGKWSRIAEHTVHKASVNSISWAPQEYGALLLCASSDGNVSIVEFKDDGTTSSSLIEAHRVGVNSASWAPVSFTDSTATPSTNNNTPQLQTQIKRFVTGGCDNLVKIWNFDHESKTYTLQETLEGHKDWVRDVAWSPSSLIRSYIASASQDKNVIIWTQENNQGPWKKTLLKQEKFPDVCWRVSWSFSGNVLAVSSADNKITLWKENLQGSWDSAGEVDQ